MKTFYTRAGDDGTTDLLGEGRVPKADLRIEALGCLDEANSVLGMVRAFGSSTDICSLIQNIQRDLYMIMAEVAATEENTSTFRRIAPRHTLWLEEKVAEFGRGIKLPREFILPGDNQLGAFLDMARTVVRRAERRLSELMDTGSLQNSDILSYLNRLSSLCFVLEIRESMTTGRDSPTLAKDSSADDRNLD